MTTNTTTINAWDKIMMAITFAEVGERGTAKDILNRKQQRPEARTRKESVNRPELRLQ